MNPKHKYQKGLQYSEDIRNAVLFGYLYRKEAEKKREVLVHFCLGDASEVLQWLASVIISGFVIQGVKAFEELFAANPIEDWKLDFSERMHYESCITEYITE